MRGAAAVGGAPGSLPAKQPALQPRPALLRRAQPAREAAGREEGADPLQEVRALRGGGPGGRGPGRGGLRPRGCSGRVTSSRLRRFSVSKDYAGRTAQGQCGWGLGGGMGPPGEACC